MSDIYKVVKIIDENQIVVSGGKNAGMTLDDVLEVYETGSEITDPDTNESLGTLDLIKAKVIIKDLLPQMAICVNEEKEENGIFPSNPFSSTHRKRLNVDSTEISGGLTGSKKIKIGDLVRKEL